ncbi:c-type cytochrome [Massilia sp. CFBP9012]|uniref:c-type cytochrome n=1 Tax=Massilia sp. CFBP9012 TaxID=3096531 RepID=UPI002A6A75D2|nr:c-type cytochrome [Massilia sp. CFBP9012]MDY0974384.1 c-type cytochrome [Massilia sp. CFBP9012]
MSDAHNEHQSLIRTPKQLVVAVTAFFLVIVLGIILLVVFVTSTATTGAGTDSQSAEAISNRIRPVSEEGFILVDANAPRVLQAGGAVYAATCAACHDSGMAGAPKTGDNGAWGARLAQGYDTVLKHAIEGIRAMPAKGGNPDLDNLEVERAVVFMANKSGASFKEPAEPAPAPAAAEAPADAAATATAPAAAASPAATPAPAAATAAAPAAAPAIASADLGKKAYDSACIACHGAGIAGAPKFGDKAAWTARLGQGANVMYEHAIKGFQGKTGFMPPKGGATIPDAEVKAAVDYMVAAVK